MPGQWARRRGADAAPAQREQDHVLDEGVGIGQGDRDDGCGGRQESGRRSSNGRTAARCDGDQGDADREEEPDCPLQG
ncbi:hypothetical protein [Streptomyces sp. SID12488]|uniref:hypothetical protein n=1 Tax=Streptomyces sp. SID12488 TaxID=2706040 RepID=UPI0013DC855E|nr:hypothetical protein [Streptomyces sp. SID12488]